MNNHAYIFREEGLDDDYLEQCILLALYKGVRETGYCRVWTLSKGDV